MEGLGRGRLIIPLLDLVLLVSSVGVDLLLSCSRVLVAIFVGVDIDAGLPVVALDVEANLRWRVDSTLNVNEDLIQLD